MENQTDTQNNIQKENSRDNSPSIKKNIFPRLRFGLKIWSINNQYFTEISRLFEQNKFSYLEIFSVPDSYEETGKIWKDFVLSRSIPVIVHAPHHTQGMNLADKNRALSNERLAAETFLFADDTNAQGIIFHPGCDGNEFETVFQLNNFNDDRIIIENKPRMGIDGITSCCGWNPQQIGMIINKTDSRFCLDISHAFCAAYSEGLDPYRLLGDFNRLNPAIYHLCDNEIKSPKDLHKHIGEGDYDFVKIAETLGWGAKEEVKITLEVPKKYKDCLVDFVEDTEKLKEIFR